MIVMRLVIAIIILFGAGQLAVAQLQPPHSIQRIYAEAIGVLWLLVGLSWAAMLGIFKVITG